MTPTAPDIYRVEPLGTGWAVLGEYGDVFSDESRTQCEEVCDLLNSEANGLTEARSLNKEAHEILGDCIQSLTRLSDADGAYRVTVLQQARKLLDKLELQ